jgi:hypothetical protein
MVIYISNRSAAVFSALLGCNDIIRTLFNSSYLRNFLWLLPSVVHYYIDGIIICKTFDVPNQNDKIDMIIMIINSFFFSME